MQFLTKRAACEVLQYIGDALRPAAVVGGAQARRSRRVCDLRLSLDDPLRQHSTNCSGPVAAGGCGRAMATGWDADKIGRSGTLKYETSGSPARCPTPRQLFGSPD